MCNPFRRTAAVDRPRPVGFGSRAPYAHCPAEGRDTPHQFDIGRRRCLVCKTITTRDEDD